jgi:hypothetical protein
MLGLGFTLFLVSSSASAQEWPPWEYDDRFGVPASVCDPFVDLGRTYQYADDYDDDGIEDLHDNCPHVANRDQGNADGDAMGDVCDSCVVVRTEVLADLDEDGLGDECDDDVDGDEVADDADNCPNVTNPVVDGLQSDTDDDGIGDACDTDDDDDGFADLEDSCPLVSNPGQEAIEADRCFADTDGDEVYDQADNCVAERNPEQVDTDGDEVGDECDADLDGDGVLNDLDSCPTVMQEAQIDLDRDGVGEECDDRYCYVVMSDTENCLDPSASFRVYTPSLQGVRTGDGVRLRLFANRELAPIQYLWSVIDAPEDSLAKVVNDYGSVRCSTPWEYHYAENNVASFTPDEPGEYAIRLEATQVWDDAVSGDAGETSEAIAYLVVEGESLNDGCSAVPLRDGGRRSDLGLVALALALLVAERTRRRRSATA